MTLGSRTATELQRLCTDFLECGLPHAALALRAEAVRKGFLTSPEDQLLSKEYLVRTSAYRHAKFFPEQKVIGASLDIAIQYAQIQSPTRLVCLGEAAGVEGKARKREKLMYQAMELAERRGNFDLAARCARCINDIPRMQLYKRATNLLCGEMEKPKYLELGLDDTLMD